MLSLCPEPSGGSPSHPRPKPKPVMGPSPSHLTSTHPSLTLPCYIGVCPASDLGRHGAPPPISLGSFPQAFTFLALPGHLSKRTAACAPACVVLTLLYFSPQHLALSALLRIDLFVYFYLLLLEYQLLEGRALVSHCCISCALNSFWDIVGAQ